MTRHKARDVARHARQKAWARFGLTAHDIDAVVAMIQRGESTVVEKQSLRVTVHAVTFKDQTMHVVYDREHKRAVTFLYPQGDPLGWYQPQEATT